MKRDNEKRENTFLSNSMETVAKMYMTHSYKINNIILSMDPLAGRNLTYCLAYLIASKREKPACDDIEKVLSIT